MELIRQLWTTSSAFRVFACVTAVSGVLALTTAGQSPAVTETVTPESPGEEMLDRLRQHIPGQAPASASGQILRTADKAAQSTAKAAEKAIDVFDATLDKVGKKVGH